MGKESQEETYEMRIHCDNCNDYETAEIPMGTTVKEWLKTDFHTSNFECDYCGCTIRRKCNRIGSFGINKAKKENTDLAKWDIEWRENPLGN